LLLQKQEWVFFDCVDDDACFTLRLSFSVELLEKKIVMLVSFLFAALVKEINHDW
jgi:hypothetical protein